MANTVDRQLQELDEAIVAVEKALSDIAERHNQANTLVMKLETATKAKRSELANLKQQREVLLKEKAESSELTKLKQQKEALLRKKEKATEVRKVQSSLAYRADRFPAAR